MQKNLKPSFEKKWVDSSKDKEVGIINPSMSMWDHIYNYNKNNMQEIAVNFMKDRITYDEMFSKIDEVSKSFVNSGVSSGDVVPLVLATVPEAAYCIYALNKIGAIACMIDPRNNEFRMLNDIGSTNSELLVSLKNASKALKNVKKSTDISEVVMLSALNSAKNPIIRKIFDLKDFVDGNVVPYKTQGWQQFIDSGSNIPTNYNYYVENNPAVIVFTGGTTGVHKGVLLSNEALNTTVLEHRFLIDGVNRGDKFLDILPPFIAYGLTSLHLSFSYGLETILNPVPDPKRFAQQISDSGAAIAFGGPIHWEALAHAKNIDKMDFSNLKFPVSGGEKLPRETAEIVDKALSEHGCKEGIFDGYGASECCGVFSLYQPSKNSKGTVGYPLRFNSMCIVNPDTNEELDYNQHGEICIDGPSVMNGYYNNDAETNKVIFYDDCGRRWFKTGDLGYINDKGELIITGRLKRIFVCGVNKVYPPEMEKIIMEFNEVRKCVVTGIDDPDLRTVPKVHLILNNGVDNVENLYQRITEEISNKLSPEVIPRYYQIDDDFLYTGSGKIDYMEMARIDNETINKNQENKKLKRTI